MVAFSRQMHRYSPWESNPRARRRQGLSLLRLPFRQRSKGWWYETDSNRRRAAFQTAALPTELPHHRAPGRIRTSDQLVRSQPLCPLSYKGKGSHRAPLAFAAGGARVRGGTRIRTGIACLLGRSVGRCHYSPERPRAVGEPGNIARRRGFEPRPSVLETVVLPLTPPPLGRPDGPRESGWRDSNPRDFRLPRPVTSQHLLTLMTRRAREGTLPLPRRLACVEMPLGTMRWRADLVAGTFAGSVPGPACT